MGIVGDFATKDKRDIRLSIPIKDDSNLTPNLEQIEVCRSASSLIREWL